MVISFGVDHGGFVVADDVIKHLENSGHKVIFFGTHSSDSCDYPDYAKLVCKSVLENESEFGILICGTGIGMSMVANKFKGIRCAHVNDCFSAEMTRKHNHANVIALGARIATLEEIIKYIDVFLNTTTEGGRHDNRVNKIKSIEEENFR